MYCHQPTELQPGDEIVLFRDREQPQIAFFRGGMRLRPDGGDRPLDSLCGGCLAPDVLDPGSGACRSFARLFETLSGKFLEQIPVAVVIDRYTAALERPCAAWRVR
jgi:hypothetical protein